MNAKGSGHADRMGPFIPGQKVSTSFGPGVVSGFSEIDLIVYVALGNDRNATYVLRPEQVERMEG
jgi:hypothetical protein